MRNVIVVALGSGRYAIDLRWVQEIFTLTHLTPIPTAPPSVAGAVNFRGAILPVLAIAPLVAATHGGPSPTTRPAAPGDTVVLLDVNGARAGVTVDRVDAVSSLVTAPDGESVVDAAGRDVPLIDPQAMLEAARRQVAEAAVESARLLGGGGRVDG